jgi:putative ABC transport system substrate-binding protein
VKRRDFALVLRGAMRAARSLGGQQKTMPVIGWLSAISPAVQGGSRMPELGTYESLPADALTPLAAFAQGLSESGYVEGRNVAIQYRWAEGHPDRLPALAADLVSQKVDVIVAVAGNAPAQVAKRETSSIPIVFTSAWDPVESGLVASLARPEGNLTGFAFSPANLDPKRLALVCELVPKAGVIGLLVYASEQNQGAVERYTREMQDAARAKGVQLLALEAISESEIDATFASLARLHAGALVVASDPFFTAKRTAGGTGSALCCSGHLSSPPFCRARGPDQLRLAPSGLASWSWDLCRPDSRGRKAGRPTGPTGHHIRTGGQSQDRQGAWPDRAAIDPRPRRRGH